MPVIHMFKNGIHLINLLKIQDINIFYVKEKVQKKNDFKVVVGKMKTKFFFCPFFKCSFNFRAHALQSELNKVIISNVVPIPISEYEL